MVTQRVLLNGEWRPVPIGSTIADLLADLGRAPSAVAVEHNGRIVARQRYSGTVLADGDRLEIVQFVQGGALASAAQLV